MKDRLKEFARSFAMMVIAVPLSLVVFVIVAWCLAFRPDESCEYTNLNDYGDDTDSAP